MKLHAQATITPCTRMDKNSPFLFPLSRCQPSIKECGKPPLYVRPVLPTYLGPQPTRPPPDGAKKRATSKALGRPRGCSVLADSSPVYNSNSSDGLGESEARTRMRNARGELFKPEPQADPTTVGGQRQIQISPAITRAIAVTRVMAGDSPDRLTTLRSCGIIWHVQRTKRSRKSSPPAASYRHLQIYMKGRRHV